MDPMQIDQVNDNSGYFTYASTPQQLVLPPANYVMNPSGSMNNNTTNYSQLTNHQQDFKSEATNGLPFQETKMAEVANDRNVVSESDFRGGFNPIRHQLSSVTTLRPDNIPSIRTEVKDQDSYTLAGLRSVAQIKEKYFMSGVKIYNQILALIGAMEENFIAAGKAKYVEKIYEIMMQNREQSMARERQIRKESKRAIRMEKMSRLSLDRSKQNL